MSSLVVMVGHCEKPSEGSFSRIYGYLNIGSHFKCQRHPFLGENLRKVYGRTSNRPTTGIAIHLVSAYIITMKISWRVEDEWLEWYRLTPADRWRESQKLWEFYLSSGGNLNSEPDSQSPFDPLYSQSESTLNGGAGVRPLRRSRV